MKSLFSDTGSFSSFDFHFAQFICKLSEAKNPDLFLAAALTTKALREGHVCCSLEEMAGKQFQMSFGPFALPPVGKLRNELSRYPVIGAPGTYRPLILENNRLYLYRYWKYEQDLARSLLLRTRDKNAIDVHELDILAHSVSGQPGSASGQTVTPEVDWQHAASVISLLNSFTVICGGPGTGKTTAAARILALLTMCLKNNPRIALAASTGKAAARLADSIQSHIPAMNLPGDIRNKIPRQAHTIHRLLGTIPLSPDFRHNSAAPLPYDIILVDEASMIDLALMTRLVLAVPQKSHLILMGDRDQLSSVETGSVLGDICDTGNNHQFTIDQSEILNKTVPGYNESGNPGEPPFADCIVHLRKSYRFGDDSGIGRLSRAINQGNISGAMDVLASSRFTECIWKPLPHEYNLPTELKSMVLDNFSGLSSEKDPADALAFLDKFKILCAVRQGPYGVVSINDIVINILRNAGLISRDSGIYPGLPVLIDTNDYMLDLYNGDSGIVIPGLNSYKDYRVAFRGQKSVLRTFRLQRLRSWEVAYALTVHKSQGSEFDHITLILPPVPSPVLTRELLYTAVTRARKSVEIWSTDTVLEKTLLSRTNRHSGLRDRLWGN